jgi:hypothetical protein
MKLWLTDGVCHRATTERVDMRNAQGYRSPRLGKKTGAGIGTPVWSGDEPQCVSQCGFFVAWCSLLWRRWAGAARPPVHTR